MGGGRSVRIHRTHSGHPSADALSRPCTSKKYGIFTPSTGDISGTRHASSHPVTSTSPKDENQSYATPTRPILGTSGPLRPTLQLLTSTIGMRDRRLRSSIDGSRAQMRVDVFYRVNFMDALTVGRELKRTLRLYRTATGRMVVRSIVQS